MGKDIGCLTHSFAGKDFINGNLEKSIFAELTHDFVTRWDESYPLLEFPPCSKLQDKDVDPFENRRIPQEKFNKVPLIQELVNRFQDIFCHLTTTQVWLLRKSKIWQWISGLASGQVDWDNQHYRGEPGRERWCQEQSRGKNGTEQCKQHACTDQWCHGQQQQPTECGWKYQRKQRRYRLQRSNGEEKSQARTICNKGYENLWKSCTWQWSRNRCVGVTESWLSFVLIVMCKDCLRLCTDSKKIQVVSWFVVNKHGIITHDGTSNDY